MKKLILTLSLISVLGGCGYFFKPQEQTQIPTAQKTAKLSQSYEDLRPIGITPLNSWVQQLEDGRRTVVGYSCHSLAPERINARVDVYAAGTTWTELRTAEPLESYECEGAIQRYSKERFAPRKCKRIATSGGLSKDELFDLVTRYKVRE